MPGSDRASLCAKVHPLDLHYTFRPHSLRQGPHSGPSVHFPAPILARRSTLWTFRTLSGPILCAKVHTLDLPYNFRSHSLREGPHSGPSVHFPAPILARRSTLWTFSTLSGPIPCAKVHTLDLRYNFRSHSLREGPHSGPSVHFPAPILARRSTLWTFSTLSGPILCAKVHTLDLRYTFRPHSLRQGPHSGPSVHFPAPFLARRSTLWTFSTLSGPILCVKVHTLDLPYTFRPHSLREGPHSGPSGW